MTGRARRALPVLAAALAVVLLGAAAAAHLLIVRPHERLDQARAEGLAAARARTEQVLTFSPDTVETDLARARDAVTGRFGDDFRRVLGGLVEPAVRQGIGTKTTVSRAGVVSADENRVTALLFLSQTAASGDAPPRRTLSRAEVTVERVGKQWLIADLRNF